MTWELFAERSLEFLAFRWSFAVDGLITGVIVGALCGLVGVFMVLRRLSLVGDATGHATLPGVCVAFLLTGSKTLPVLLAGALASGLLANAAIAGLLTLPRTRPDAVIGVVLSVFFGLGIVLLSYVQVSPTGAQSGLQSFLFGSAAGVARSQVVTIAVLALAVAALVLAFLRPLTLATFDPVFAGSVGVPVRAIEYATLLVLAVVVVVSIRTVGVVLVAAMLVVPPSAALLVCRRRIGAAAAVSALVGAFSGAVGTYVSFVFEGLSTGPTMVVVAGVIFAATFALSRFASRVHRAPRGSGGGP